MSSRQDSKELTYNGLRPDTVVPGKSRPRGCRALDVVDQMTEIIFGDHNAARSSP